MFATELPTALCLHFIVMNKEWMCTVSKRNQVKIS